MKYFIISKPFTCNFTAPILVIVPMHIKSNICKYFLEINHSQLRKAKGRKLLSNLSCLISSSQWIYYSAYNYFMFHFVFNSIYMYMLTKYRIYPVFCQRQCVIDCILTNKCPFHRKFRTYYMHA